MAPFIGVGYPGFIEADGSIERGAQNLPGNWQSKSFNLARSLAPRLLAPRKALHVDARRLGLRLILL
jgi:hypothetical protein